MTAETKSISAYETTCRFLSAAIADGALKELNPNASDIQARNRNIFGIYFFAPVRLEDLGGIYHLTRERVRQVIQREAKQLWQNCSPEVKQQYPFLQIPLGKPLSSYWQHFSKVHGGRSLAALSDLNAGSSPKEIAQKQHLTSKQMAGVRAVLGRHGYQMPYSIMTKAEEEQIITDLQQSGNDQQIQAGLDKITTRRLRDFGISSGVLESLKTTLSECGFRHHPRQMSQIVRVVKMAQIPLGIIEADVHARGSSRKARYYSVFSSHRGRIQEALLANPYLQERCAATHNAL